MRTARTVKMSKVIAAAMLSAGVQGAMGSDAMQEGLQEGYASFRLCAHKWVKTYAKAKEPAADLADAGIASCAAERNEGIAVASRKSGLPEHRVLTIFDLKEKQLRGDLMRVVIETRFK